MSGEDEAPSGHPNALIALSRRLRTVSPKELPIVERCVLLAVAGRAGADWIAFPPVEWVAREAGTTPNTARRALDWLVKVSGWLGLEAQATPRASARYRIRLDPVPPTEVRERYPGRGAVATPQGCSSDTPPRGDGAAPQGVSSDTPGGEQRHPRGDGAAPVDHRKIPDRSQKESHLRPHAHAGVQQVLIPDLEPRPEPGATVAAKGGKPPKDPKPKPRKPSPEDPSTLGHRERAAYEAIAADASLQPITQGVCALVRDLCGLYPRLDIVREVKKAGAWMRGDPSDPRRRKKKGGPFLQNWMASAEEREAPTRTAEQPDPFAWARTRKPPDVRKRPPFVGPIEPIDPTKPLPSFEECIEIASRGGGYFDRLPQESE